MTLRSDTTQLNVTLGTSPATTAYFFHGLKQDNQIPLSPSVGGISDPDKGFIYLRGRDMSGKWYSNEELMGSFVHESSHVLVHSYGQHPKSSLDAASFDRYKDEFRAYCISYPYTRIEDFDARADAIREYIVGKPKLLRPAIQNCIRRIGIRPTWRSGIRSTDTSVPTGITCPTTRPWISCSISSLVPAAEQTRLTT